MRDRLRTYIHHKGITIYSFCKQAGLARNFLQWETAGISAKSMQKIGQAYPDLNLQWVATGEGEMLKGDEDKIPLSVHRALISDREARIEQLEGIVAKLRAKINILKNK
jgi:hypothetical protein